MWPRRLGMHALQRLKTLIGTQPLIELLKPILNLFYPAICTICRLPLTNDDWLCKSCRLEIIRSSFVDPCPRCSSELPKHYKVISGCPKCIDLPESFSKTGAAGMYSGKLRELIIDFKYNRRETLAYPLGALMVEKLKQLKWDNEIDIIVPTPIHIKRNQERTFNQSELLAEIVAQSIKKKLCSNILIRIKPTLPQVKFTQKHRLKNIKGAFELASSFMTDNSIRGKTVLLIDDVMTTGATATECSKMLKKANPKEIRVLVAARTGAPR